MKPGPDPFGIPAGKRSPGNLSPREFLDGYQKAVWKAIFLRLFKLPESKYL
jgi:hypothetical protein